METSLEKSSRSKDETSGNQSCTTYVEKNGTLSFRIRLPNAFIESYGTYLQISNIKFDYGHEDILAALLAKQAISFRFKSDEKGWRIFVSIDVAAAPLITNEKLGRIGVDINSNHLSLVETDRFGNPIHKETIPVNLYGKDSNQSKAIIGDACKKIVELAGKTKKPIVLEKLNFRQKKISLRESSPRYARMLSSFAYSNILTQIKSRGHKQGIEIQEVNPAYTSIIGRVKFSKRYGLSTHHAAALVIARRNLRFSEKLPLSLKDIPDGKDGCVALSVPVRKRSEHVWASWKKLSKKLSVELAARFRAKKNRSRDPCKTTHVM
jgi:IS605 OrfB family transposase